MSSFFDRPRFPLFDGSLFNNSFLGNQYLDKLNAFQGPLFAGTPSTANVGNVAGVANATSQTPSSLEKNAAMLKAIYTDPALLTQPEAVRIATINQLAAMNNTLDLEKVTKQLGLNREKEVKMFLDAEERRAERANEMGRENLELTNKMTRSNTVLRALLDMPSEVANTLVQASTAHLPYEREARQMMANTGANLQAGYSNLANMNTQFGNQVSTLFSNAAAYRPTLIAGKYF